MNAKTTSVTLVANGVSRDFNFEHAERLLRMPRNGGWKLPEDSKYEFVGNALHKRRNTKENSGK